MDFFFILFLILIIVVAYIYYYRDGRIFGGGGSGKIFGGGGIIWYNNRQYTTQEIVEMIAPIEKNMSDFGPIRPDEMKFLRNYSKKTRIPLGQLISFRNILATQKSINAKRYSHKFRSEILAYQKSGEKMEKIFEKFPLPPLEIVSIMKEVGAVDPDIEKIARRNDSENASAYRQIMFDAEVFERGLIKWLRENYPEIHFKSQEELVAEQIRQYGRAVATPDVLFDEPIIFTIRDGKNEYQTPVRWLDAKNFTLIKAPFIIKHIEKQVDRYNKYYGPGALVFHYGFTQHLQFPGAIILEASFI